MMMHGSRRVGLWLVGAYGGVGASIALGLACLERGLCDTTGLVTALPWFEGLGLPHFDQFVLGGHEIRTGSFEQATRELNASSRLGQNGWIEACSGALAAASDRVCPGVALNAGPAVQRLADWAETTRDQSPAEAVARITADLDAFRRAEGIDHLIVLNVASTEPPLPLAGPPDDADRLLAGLDRPAAGLPSSTLYAIAALQAGHTYINFTPSTGCSLAAVKQIAARSGALHAGKDAKTGETLLKTVLAPMFAARNLRVLSWVGHNIFGNRDGVVLDDPAHKASKLGTKDAVVAAILGYRPNTLVSIEYVPDLADWKTAWDHIHFQGFLGCPMTLQLTWQGCDSLLAAPLAIDLCRLADLAKQRGESGGMPHLACFFKSPEDVAEHDFFAQLHALRVYCAQARD